MKTAVLFLLASQCYGLAPNCGKRKEQGSNVFISGGTEALPNEFPWHVALQSGRSNVCAGSILNKHWIVTAAHCVMNRKSGYTVLAGKHNMKRTEKGQEIRNVTKIRIHPLSWAQHRPYDIALLKLSSPLNFNKNRRIGPVCLPDPKNDKDAPGKMCTATGWGVTGTGGRNRWMLQKVDLPIATSKECQKDFPQSGLLKESSICAGHGSGNKGICAGDSGGPLVCLGNNTRWFLAGIASKSWNKCGRYNVSALFTRIMTVLEWIRAQMGHDD